MNLQPLSHASAHPTRRTLALLAMVALGLTACASDADVAPTTTRAVGGAAGGTTTTIVASSAAPGSSMSDIVGTALAATVFNDLAGFAVQAGLVDALRGGPFTVFAPTDAAFAKLPLPVLHAVEDTPELLTTVLEHHIVAGSITPAQMQAGELKTLAGDTLTVTKVGATFYVDGNEVGTAVAASNGTVYVMGDVLVPALGTVVDVATTLPGFATLVSAVQRANLVDTLSGPGPFTVFAPVDAAFAALPTGALAALLADPAALAKALEHHVVAGDLNVDQLVDGTLPTLDGGTLTVSHRDGVTLIDGNPILVQNVQATNGVVHVIGAVLTPAA